jgi:O-antigen/teichoic acid export membrane protein
LEFGMHIVAINAMNIVLVNADYLVIGHFMDAAALGVYTLAFRIPDLIIVNFCALIGYVVFPLYAKLRNDSDALTRGFLMTTRYVAFVTVPISLGMILVARPLILAVFGSKWGEAVPVLQAISVYSLMLSLAFNAGDFYKAQGRPEILTQISFFRMLVLVPSLYWAASQAKSIIAVGWTHATVAFIFGLISLVIASKLLHAPLKELAVVLRPAVLAGLVMGAFVLMIRPFTQNSSELIQLIAGVATGGFTYIITLWIIDRPTVLETVRILRGALEK